MRRSPITTKRTRVVDGITDTLRRQAFVLNTILELVMDRSLDSGAALEEDSLGALERMKLDIESLQYWYKQGHSMPSKKQIEETVESRRRLIYNVLYEEYVEKKPTLTQKQLDAYRAHLQFLYQRIL